jgi:hypothetical protein
MRRIVFILLGVMFPIVSFGQGMMATSPMSNLNIGTTTLSISCIAGTGGVSINQIVSFAVGGSTCVPSSVGAVDSIGIAQSTAAAGVAFEVSELGRPTCIADNTWTIGDLIGSSVTTAGSCADLGTASSATIPIGTQVVGRALASCSTGTPCLMNTLGAGHHGMSGSFMGTLTLNGSAGTMRGVYAQTSGVNRWVWGASVIPEQGNNTGSDWILNSYGDNGATGVTAIDVVRGTGQVTFGTRPIFGVATPWDSSNLNFSAPPAIGGANPNAGTFTTATVTTQLTVEGSSTFSARPSFYGQTPWDTGNLTIVPDVQVTVATTQVPANSCLPSATTYYSVIMLNLISTMTATFTPSTNYSSVTGWSAAGGTLYFNAYPTGGALQYQVCNNTSASITPSASTVWNVSAR